MIARHTSKSESRRSRRPTVLALINCLLSGSRPAPKVLTPADLDLPDGDGTRRVGREARRGKRVSSHVSFSGSCCARLLNSVWARRGKCYLSYSIVPTVFRYLYKIIWRSGRDSNPRYAFDVYSLSRRAPSTTRPPLRRNPIVAVSGVNRVHIPSHWRRLPIARQRTRQGVLYLSLIHI